MCISLSTSTQPASKGWLVLLAPLGVPHCCWERIGAFSWTKSWNSCEFTGICPYSHLLSKCAPCLQATPKVIAFHHFPVLKADLSRLKWETDLKPTSTRSRNSIISPVFCEPGCCDPQDITPWKIRLSVPCSDSLWGTWGFGEGNLAVHARCFYSKRKRTFLPAPERVCPQSFSSESSIQIWCTVSCISLLPNSQIHFLPGSGAHLYHSKSGSEAKIWWVMPRPFCCDLTVLRWMKSSGEICSPHRNNCCQRQLSGAW